MGGPKFSNLVFLKLLTLIIALFELTSLLFEEVVLPYYFLKILNNELPTSFWLDLCGGRVSQMILEALNKANRDFG